MTAIPTMTPRMKHALSVLAERGDRALYRLHSGLWFRESDAEPGSHRWERFRNDERPYYGGYLWNVPGKRVGTMQVIWLPDESTMVLAQTIQALARRGILRLVGPTKKEFDGYVGKTRAVLTATGMNARDATPPPARQPLRLVKG
ncbi:MAG: hypothetical protein LCH79_14285 [Proteobacteria bacterium]|nr:hypothetical protein [Pseudomonadota bacterium]